MGIAKQKSRQKFRRDFFHRMIHILYLSTVLDFLLPNRQFSTVKSEEKNKIDKLRMKPVDFKD